MTRSSLKTAGIATVLIVIVLMFLTNLNIITNKINDLVGLQGASVAASVTSPFVYRCSVNGTLAESGNMNESSSPYFWLNSGAYTYLKDGVCQTIQGELSQNNKWRIYYNKDNSIDTDNGFHPQNIYRLITRSKWLNATEEISVKITKQNLSESQERDAWSGILLFSRYVDSNNLYYLGIRDDGHVVIKSKKNGVYKTLSEVPYYPGVYNRTTNPTLLPINQWIGIKSEVVNNPNNTVSLKLYISSNNDGVWTLVTSAIDSTNPILNDGYSGLRTDFRDVLWDNLRIANVSSNTIAQ